MTNITCDQLVQREVIYCVSYLINELVKQDKYMDELLPVCIQDDWETPATEEGWDNDNTDEYGCHYFLNTDGSKWAAKNDASGWRDLCEAHDIDPQTNEAFEHWIVSGWLADKLEAEGEMIVRDFLGMTIWGRSCTGQAIAMDGVIQKIHANLIGKAA